MLPSITCIALFSALYTNQPAHRTDVFPYSVTELVTAKDGSLAGYLLVLLSICRNDKWLRSFQFTGHNSEPDRGFFDKVRYHSFSFTQGYQFLTTGDRFGLVAVQFIDIGLCISGFLKSTVNESLGKIKFTIDNIYFHNYKFLVSFIHQPTRSFASAFAVISHRLFHLFLACPFTHWTRNGSLWETFQIFFQSFQYFTRPPFFSL